MKRTVEVVVLVDVVCDNEKDVAEAIKDLKREPPFISKSVMGFDDTSYHGAYHMESRRRVASVKVRGAK